LFKSGIRPEWEDPQNKDGGKWSFMFMERRSADIDEVWLHVLLGAIGETLEPDDANEVMGVMVNVRKAFIRVGCWTRSAGRDAASRGKLMEIGRNFKKVLMLRDIEFLEFTGHVESSYSGGSYHRVKSSFFI
jgi:translation initiation factor 4E